MCFACVFADLPHEKPRDKRSPAPKDPKPPKKQKTPVSVGNNFPNPQDLVDKSVGFLTKALINSNAEGIDAVTYVDNLKLSAGNIPPHQFETIMESLRKNLGAVANSKPSAETMAAQVCPPSPISGNNSALVSPAVSPSEKSSAAPAPVAKGSTASDPIDLTVGLRASMAKMDEQMRKWRFFKTKAEVLEPIFTGCIEKGFKFEDLHAIWIDAQRALLQKNDPASNVNLSEDQDAPK
jgi:hypothetical protein